MAGVNGSKAHFTHQSFELTQHGIAGVRMEYRLKSQGGMYTNVIEDVLEAIDFVRQRADELNLDFSRVALAGGSAGGHLSAIAAQLTPECICYDGFNGLYDAFDRDNGRFGGGDYTGTTEAEKKQASALYLIKDNPPDTLLYHGTDDTTIDIAQSYRFAEAIRKKGGHAEVLAYKGVGHSFFNREPYLSQTTQTLLDHVSQVFGLGKIFKQKKGRKPNVVVVFTDDIGYGDISFFNPDSGFETPAVDTLAKEGMAFRQTHSTAAVCAPSRYAVLTGNRVYRGRNPGGVWIHCSPSQILPGQQTIADVLRANGYVTAFFGKLHLGGQFRQRGSNQPAGLLRDADLSRRMFDGPIDHGFDYSLTLPSGIQHAPYAFFENDRLSRWNPEKNAFDVFGTDAEARRHFIFKPKKGQTLETVGTAWNETYEMDNYVCEQVGPILAFKALEFIDRQVAEAPDKPFFIHYCAEAAHHPFAPPVDLSPGDPDRYNQLGSFPVAGKTPTARTDMVYESDVVLQVLVAKLKALGIYDNTIIVYTSDNGAAQGKGEWSDPKYYNFKWGGFGGDRIDREPGREGFVKNPQGVADNGQPLKGQKGDIYEGGHRIPLVMAGPGIQKGKSSGQLVGLHDLFATLCDLAGIAVPEGQAVDSIGFADVLRGERPESQPVRTWLQAQGRVPVTYEQAGVKRIARKNKLKPVRRTDGWITGLEGKKSPTGKKISNLLERSSMGRALYHQENGKRWKLILSTDKRDVSKNLQVWEFYELVSDPDESENLVDNPEYQPRIEAMLEGYRKTVSERPNVLWLTLEDTSDYMLGCYGNPQARTPNMDALAARGIRYENASSLAPQCSPARSTIISGCQPAFWGHDQHRGRREADHPDYLFPKLLREAGYFCTNNKKTDYNNGKEWLEKNLSKAWNDCSKTATYNDPARKKGQPFFAVFNTYLTHMNCVATIGRDFRETPRIPPSEVILPPHVPDLPAVRDDFAQHLNRVEQADKWVGVFLADLKARGLADDTIVFVYADHGGCLPRGKGFAFDSTSFQVPLIVYVPEKWKHLCPEAPGTASLRMVDFSDLAPTVLALAGIKPPKHMQGKPFLGKTVAEGKKYQVNVKCNSGNWFDPVRTATDGRWVYIRSFIPYRADATWQDFQWRMPAQRAWDQYYLDGKADPAHQTYYQPAPPEMLFDLNADPFQLHDLSKDRKQAAKIEELRGVLADWMRETRDKGLVPLQMRERDSSASFYARLSDPSFPLDEMVAAANTAGFQSLEAVRKLAENPLPEIRFWGAVGLARLARQGVDVAAFAKPLLDDGNPDSAIAAAEALWFSGQQMEAFRFLLTGCRDGNGAAFKSMENLVLLDCGQLDPTVRKKMEINFELMAEKGGNASKKRSARVLLNRLGECDAEAVYSKSDLKQAKKKYHASKTYFGQKP